MTALIHYRFTAVFAASCMCLSLLAATARAEQQQPMLLASAFTPVISTPSMPQLLDASIQKATSVYKLNINHSETLTEGVFSKGLGRHGRTRRSKEVVSAALQLDDQIRTIGGQLTDGDAAKLRPAQKYLFELPKISANKAVWLSIGKLNGIHTPQAHTLGQTSEDHISSPLAIKLNGKTIQYVYVNGDNLHIRIPKSLLRKDGYNALQLQAGYYYSAADTIAYDRVSFENVRLEPS